MLAAVRADLRAMTKMKSMAAFLALAALSGQSFMASGRGEELETFTPIPKEPPIPKGCKEYFFNKDGDFSNRHMRRDELVFKCVASNDKVAKKKFQKWLNSQDVV